VPLSAGQLLVLDAALASRTVTLRPDLSSEPAPQLFAAITRQARPGLLLPGRPARLEIIASMTAPAAAGNLGPASATLTLQDADGVGHVVTTTAAPADGKPHELIANLGTLAHAARPLRLIGVSVGYNTPAYPLSSPTQANHWKAVLRIDAISVSAAPTGPFPAPIAAGRALAAWHPLSTDVGLASMLAGLNGVVGGAVAPAIETAAAAGAAYQVTFDPGQGPLIPQPPQGTSATPLPGPAALDLDIPAAKLPVPVIATTAFAAANGLRLGTVFPLSPSGEPVSCQLVATVTAFPAGASVVADQGAMQDALASEGDGGTLPVTGWWLSTVTGAAPVGLPAGSTVSDAAALASRLEQDPLSAAPVQAIAAVAAAAALLAALGFCVSVAASTRDRRPQRALLGALGVPPRTQAGLFCLEEALISIPAAAVGLAIGVGLAHLLVPALTLTATGALPAPAVLVVLPLGWVILIAAGLPAVPVLAAAITALRQPDPAAELRAAEAVA